MREMGVGVEATFSKPQPTERASRYRARCVGAVGYLPDQYWWGSLEPPPERRQRWVGLGIFDCRTGMIRV